MSQDKMREEFEAAWMLRYPALGSISLKRSALKHDDYANTRAKEAWWAWQASRAACVVELPSATCIRVHDYTPLEVRSYCAKAIVAAGLKCEVES